MSVETESQPDHASAARPDAPQEVEVRDAHGRVTFRGRMVDDLPHGETIEWSDKGKPLQRATVTAGQLDGELRRYDEDGNLFQVAQYRTGVAHGLTVMYASQRPVCRLAYRNGVLEGESVYYGANGRVAAVVPYKAGRMEGIATYFDPDGRVLRRMAYAADKLEGPSVTYYGNGAIQETAHYKGGLLEGKLERFFPSGKPLQHGVYRAGILVEPLRTFDEDGKVTAVLKPAPQA